MTPDFVMQTASAQRILVVEVAGLGDLVHSLPAMWAVRQAWPNAELHCLVRQQYASLLRLSPWVDRVWPYRRGDTPNLGEILGKVRALRAQHFDIAIDLMGSNHASIATWLSGARRRLVRRPGPNRARYAWRWCATDLMQHPFGHERMYMQRWHSLQQAGLHSSPPRFELLHDASLAPVPGMNGAANRYLHLSPYTKLGRKELSPTQTAELVQRLHEALPHLQVVISCGDPPREHHALGDLLRALSFTPWKVFAGTLDIPQLYTLIEGAALHLSGDTGSMHLAWLAGTPSVSWISALANHHAWAPQGEQHAVIVSNTPPRDYLCDISTNEIIARAIERVHASSAVAESPARQTGLIPGEISPEDLQAPSPPTETTEPPIRAQRADALAAPAL